MGNTILDNFARTNNTASNKQPLLTDLDKEFDTLQDHINGITAGGIAKNFNQFIQDAFPSGYTLGDDGLKDYTGFDLFDKQTVNDNYTGGTITIAATGAWTDVDATNAALVITPVMLAGDFRFVFQFSVESVTINATNETDVRFRLTDGTTNSTATPRLKLITGVIATTNTHAFNLSHTFDSLAVSAQTIKLQYFITTSTASVIKVLAATDDPIYMEVEKV